jgi:hypothetical protein
MKRCLLVLAALGALLLALAASPAFAGGILPSSNAGQTVTNTTSQENEAGAANVPVASGNNVALVNGGNQTASAGTTQQQGNVNGTQQTASQAPAPHTTTPAPCGCDSTGGQQVANRTSQENQAVAVNAPIASGNNVALYNGGSQSSSAGTTQQQGNANATGQSATQSGSGGQSQTAKNRTSQENEAGAINAPIASGNNVALVNTGDQRSSVGTTQKQGNANATGQSATQSGSGGGQSQTVKNRTKQENEAGAINVPIASGNNVALYNGGSQSSSAGTTQKQGNLNATDQSARQSGTGGYGQDQSVKNRTSQENEAGALNAPILSGNNVALVNEGNQRSDVGTTQEQGNLNATRQSGTQTGSTHGPAIWCGCDSGQTQSVSNRTSQENEAGALNAPILSGNNLAGYNGGGQRSSAGTTQKQWNLNWTSQSASQSGPAGCCGQSQSVKNSTKQENEAWALNVPVASGNNLAGYNAGGVHGNGGQTSSVGTDQQQFNGNWTRQSATQTGNGHTVTSCCTSCYTCCSETIWNLS